MSFSPFFEPSLETFEEHLQTEFSTPKDWNESMIVKAYNRSVDEKAIEEFKKKAAEEESKKKEAAAIKEKFPVGSYCRALYSGDGCFYEGKVILWNEYTCMVEFLGYKNREEVELKNVKPSKGKKTRNNQMKNANETFVQNMASLPLPPEPPMPPPCGMNNPSISAMLMSWYMAGYYTGFHQTANPTSCSAKPCCHHHY